MKAISNKSEGSKAVLKKSNQASKTSKKSKEMELANSNYEHIFTLRIQNMEYFNIRAPFFLRSSPYNLTDDAFSEAMLDVNEIISSVKKKSEKAAESPIKTASFLERLLWYLTFLVFFIAIFWILLGMLINYFWYMASPYTPELTLEYVRKNYLTLANTILPAQFWELAFYLVMILLVLVLIISTAYSCCIKSLLLEQVIFNARFSRFGKWRHESFERKKWEQKIFKKVSKVLKSYNRAQFEPLNKLRFEFVLNESSYPMCEKKRKDNVRRNICQWFREICLNPMEYIRCFRTCRFYACCCCCCFYRGTDHRVKFLKYSPSLQIYHVPSLLAEESKENQTKKEEITPENNEIVEERKEEN